MKKPAIDLASANKYFSAECFNRAWELIDKQDRSEADNVNMLALSMASFWHWTQRSDCTNENLSVGVLAGFENIFIIASTWECPMVWRIMSISKQ